MKSKLSFLTHKYVSHCFGVLVSVVWRTLGNIAGCVTRGDNGTTMRMNTTTSQAYKRVRGIAITLLVRNQTKSEHRMIFTWDKNIKSLSVAITLQG